MFPFRDATNHLSMMLLCMLHNGSLIFAILCSLCKSVATNYSRDKNHITQRNVSILTVKGAFQALLLKMLGFLQMENTDSVRLKIHWDWQGKLVNLILTWKSIAEDRRLARKKYLNCS